MANNLPQKAVGHIDGDKRKGFDPNKPTYLSIAAQRTMDAALRRSTRVVFSLSEAKRGDEQGGK